MSKPPSFPEPTDNPAYGCANYRVIYGDTDLAGHVYYGTYLRIFEMGRSELLRQAGSSYASWERDKGVMLPVRECHIEYIGSARYDDLLDIKTWVTAMSGAQVRFDYRIECAGELLTFGHTRHPFMEIATGKVGRMGLKLLKDLGIAPIAPLD